MNSRGSRTIAHGSVPPSPGPPRARSKNRRRRPRSPSSPRAEVHPRRLKRRAASNWRQTNSQANAPAAFVCPTHSRRSRRRSGVGWRATNRSCSSGATSPSPPRSDGYCAAYIYPARERLTRALDEATSRFTSSIRAGSRGSARRGARRADRTHRHGHEYAPPDDARNPSRLPGGRAVTNSNEPADAVAGIFDESRAYYVIAVARDAAAGALEDRIRSKSRSGEVMRACARANFTSPAIRRRSGQRRRARRSGVGELLPRADFSLQMNLCRSSRKRFS